MSINSSRSVIITEKFSYYSFLPFITCIERQDGLNCTVEHCLFVGLLPEVEAHGAGQDACKIARPPRSVDTPADGRQEQGGRLEAR